MKKNTRKIIQVSAQSGDHCSVYVVCDDGTLWEWYRATWMRIPNPDSDDTDSYRKKV